MRESKFVIFSQLALFRRTIPTNPEHYLSISTNFNNFHELGIIPSTIWTISTSRTNFKILFDLISSTIYTICTNSRYTLSPNMPPWLCIEHPCIDCCIPSPAKPAHKANHMGRCQIGSLRLCIVFEKAPLDRCCLFWPVLAHVRRPPPARRRLPPGPSGEFLDKELPVR